MPRGKQTVIFADNFYVTASGGRYDGEFANKTPICTTLGRYDVCSQTGWCEYETVLRNQDLDALSRINTCLLARDAPHNNAANFCPRTHINDRF